ncbi:hypothetical protein H311_04163, partial [Anncaliia algerae PRA109]
LLLHLMKRKTYNGSSEGSTIQQLKIFFLCLIPDRNAKTVLGVFEQYIQKGSLIITDGYYSYTQSVKEFDSFHALINHSEGFKNGDGLTTNSIINLWSHLKKDCLERAGINKTRINLFIKEFWWLRSNIKYIKKDNIIESFSKIIIDLNN